MAPTATGAATCCSGVAGMVATTTGAAMVAGTATTAGATMAARGITTDGATMVMDPFIPDLLRGSVQAGLGLIL